MRRKEKRPAKQDEGRTKSSHARNFFLKGNAKQDEDRMKSGHARGEKSPANKDEGRMK